MSDYGFEKIDSRDHIEASTKRRKLDDDRWAEERTDPEDNALSAWANSQTNVKHRLCAAILDASGVDSVDEAQEKGVPLVYEVLCLIDEHGFEVGRLCRPTSVPGAPWQTKRDWFIFPEFQQDRKFVPSGPNSRIQKQRGYREVRLMAPIKPYLTTACAGIGLPVGYGVLRDHDQKMDRDSILAQLEENAA